MQSQCIVHTSLNLYRHTFNFDVIKFQNCLHALATHLTLKFQNGLHKLKYISITFNFDVFKFQNGTVDGIGDAILPSVPKNLKHRLSGSQSLLTGCCKEWYFGDL